MPQRGQIRRSALVLLRGLVLVAAVTAFSYRLGLNSASAALLYLIAVALQSLDSGFAEAAAVSLAAVGCLDYFFIDPPFSLAVAHPLDQVTLMCLVVTSLVITQIQARRRAEKAEAKVQRENMERLYKLGEQLLALPAGTGLGPALLRPFLSAFDLTAVCVFDANTLESYEAGTSQAGLEMMTRGAFISGRDETYPEAGVVVRCLRARDTVLGAIGFEGLHNSELTELPLIALAAAAVARARSFQSAADAAAHAQAEVLRSAILDALAHEIKTPLATILTAAGGIRAAGSMLPQQSELAEMIETEASGLGELTSRLLRVARLDSEEVKPRLEPVDPAELVARSVKRYSRTQPERQISFRKQAEIPETLVDSELILLAISQLLENACKYSRPDARVIVDLKTEGAVAAITVWNDGAPIPVAERDLIFSRFYRGTAARRIAPGSGLGLFVARKIALAHGGDLALVDTGTEGVGFRLTLPAIEGAVVE
jgi:two-component system, OmpR family, sensor histidine kinase KdpD